MARAERDREEVFARRAAGLEWLLFDVDGVLTDGGLYFTRWGEQVKRFHVQDGLGIRLAQRAGLKVGLLSGRRSAARTSSGLERRPESSPSFSPARCARRIPSPSWTLNCLTCSPQRVK